MSPVPLPRPTDAELAILGVLWSQGPCTVREVHERLQRDTGTGYTTVLKLMQIMTEKGLLDRDESQRAHVYRPRVSADTTQHQLVSDLVKRAFGGSATRLAMQALTAQKSTPEELAELRELLDTLDGGKR